MNIALNCLMLAQTEDRWTHTFFGFDSTQRFVLVLVAIGCVTFMAIVIAGITASLAGTMHRRRVEESLKRDMLDRGMAADDVVKVIEAEMPPEDAASRLVASWCKKKK